MKEDALPEILDPKTNPMIRPDGRLPDRRTPEEEERDRIALDHRAPFGHGEEVEELARKLLGCADARIEDDIRIDRDAGGRITVDGKDPGEVANDVIERLYELKVPEE